MKDSLRTRTLVKIRQWLGLWLGCLAAVLLLSHLLLAPPSSARASVASGELGVREFAGGKYALYMPASASAGGPVTLLCAFFPMGSNAVGFAASLTGMAEENGWLLLVPQLEYGDWRQIEVVRSDDKAQLPWVQSLLAALPAETGLDVREKVLLYGFSRGAQAAHRFALMYPEEVLAAALMGAGTYTLPLEALPEGETAMPLRYPVGVADLAGYCGEPFDPGEVRDVTFWVGVGALDNNPGDVPRQWDRLGGATRVERALSFAQRMAALGAEVETQVIPNIGHQESELSRANAASFLKRIENEYLEEAARTALVLP